MMSPFGQFWCGCYATREREHELKIFEDLDGADRLLAKRLMRIHKRDEEWRLARF